jgi:hypothetical protein
MRNSCKQKLFHHFEAGLSLGTMMVVNRRILGLLEVMLDGVA